MACHLVFFQPKTFQKDEEIMDHILEQIKRTSTYMNYLLFYYLSLTLVKIVHILSKLHLS